MQNTAYIVSMRVLKHIVAVWMTLVIIAGFLIPIPDIPILEQSARNLFLHVPMWMAMYAMFLAGLVYSVRFLNDGNLTHDTKAASLTQVGIVFGICGLLTGSLWARFTWGTWWTFAEPKMNLSALTLLLFVSYFILRSAVDDPRKRAKLAAVYNVFAVTTVPFLLYVIPRQLPSLHPGADGNPAFSEVTAPELRLIFYPAVIGFIGLAVVLTNLSYRYRTLKNRPS